MAKSAHNELKNNKNKKNDYDNNTTEAKPLHYLIWFRRDLRLEDNTALAAICERAKEDNARVTAVFVITPEQWQQHDQSLCQTDHLLRTLPILAKALQDQLNIPLLVSVCPTFSDSIEHLTELCKSQNIRLVLANHEYEGNEIARDKALFQKLADSDIEFERHHDQCILPPNSVCNGDGKMYQIFTPFYKKWQTTLDISPIVLHKPERVSQNHAQQDQSDHYGNLTINFKSDLHDIRELCDKVLNDYQTKWQKKAPHIEATAQLHQSRQNYPAGEAAAKARLNVFVNEDIKRYDSGRDIPSLDATSRLSAYLTLGVISPRACYLTAQAQLQKEKRASGDKNDDKNDSDNNDIRRWLSELAWRDFYRHVLVARPDLIYHHAYKKDVDAKINWSYDDKDFEAWCQGKTGVPLVDAAMKSLNATGFMHNRLRMVTAMFLTKDLLIDWRLGERYFMQQLIDGDFASNNGGWQWSASTGNDSAPYFRILNPFGQAKSHDSQAVFIKSWLPELSEVPASILNSEAKLNQALATGGKFAKTDYPLPRVEHRLARDYAIQQFKRPF